MLVGESVRVVHRSHGGNEAEIFIIAILGGKLFCDFKGGKKFILAFYGGKKC